MRNPRASRASTVRQASLPLPIPLDSENNDILQYEIMQTYHLVVVILCVCVQVNSLS